MVKFSISDPSYGFPTRWDAAQVATAQDMIRTAVKGHISANKLYADLRSANLGYRKTNVFRDLAFAKATEFSQTVAAFDRASKWFETIESINKEMGYNDRRRAIEFLPSGNMVRKCPNRKRSKPRI